jgi:hypothetical protein
MGESKYRLKAQKNVFVIIIGLIVIGAGTGAYFLLTRNNDDDVNGGNTTSERVLQLDDRFRAHYKLWIADISGPSGVIDTSAAPDEDTTAGDPMELTMDGVVEGFMFNILGLIEGDETTFTLESGEGYTTGDTAYFRLTYWVQIVEIL